MYSSSSFVSTSEVITPYPSGEQKNMVAGQVGNIVKYFALGLESTACKTIMLNPDLTKTVKKLVIKEMDNELEELCKKKKNSILRQTKPEELLAFK